MFSFNHFSKIIVTTLTAVLLVPPANAKNQVLQSYQIHFVTSDVMAKVAAQFEVEHADRIMGSYEVIVPADQAETFLKLAPTAKLLEADISRESREAFANSRINWEIAGYKTLAEVQAFITQLAQKYPELAKVEKYGTSKSGKDLLALKVSDNVNTTENEPKLMLTAATHGDEIITTEVLLRLIEQLLAHQEDPRMFKMVHEHEIYFVPVVNPDGFSQQDRYDSGRDPNRSYPGPQIKNANPTPSIAPLISFFDSHTFAGSIDFHASGGLIMFPWSWTYDVIQDATDLNWFTQTTKSMASVNGYTAGQISDVIYVAEGSSADYYYWKKKTRALGVEMGYSKAPPANQIPAYVTQIAEMTWRFIESF